MRSGSIRLFLPLLAVVLLAGCATNKDAFLNRTFHRLVSRDNAWFNANEKLKETVQAMQRAHLDDFDKVLPIFVDGDQQEAESMTPELEVCIEKCTTVIDRHTMEIGGKEKNNWVPEAWFVIGKSHFYQQRYREALRAFEYIARRYKGHDRQMEARLWLARTAMELEQYGKAQSALDVITGQKVLPKRFPHDQLSAVQADLELRRGHTDKALVALEHAVSITKVKSDRVRWTFILAQLYQKQGKQQKAIATFQKVTRMGAPYELGFHARIFQALAMDRGNSEGIRKTLGRMLRDEKNKDHYDMIHYALAELDLMDGRVESAVEQLKTSARVSTLDTRQKAKSFLKLADLFFDDKNYPDAQQYYDSTAMVLNEEHPRFDQVTVRAEVLGDLVEQLNVIAREDSLQAFAQLDPQEREQRIARLIQERERQEELDKRAAEDARERLTSTPLTPSKPGGQQSGAWYFYNPSQLSRGLADFRKHWGNRPNEDDWRRSDKSGSVLMSPEEEEELTEDAVADAAAEEEPAWKQMESYLADLPLTPAQLDSSNARICKALYLAGMIYKENLKDVDNAIESFQVLNDRFDDCHYTPESFYQLYRIYLAKEQEGSFFDFGGASSARYADIILERWPDSELAYLVQHPDRLQEDEAARVAQAHAYEEVYASFKQGAYRAVIAAADAVLKDEPDNHFRPKYALLRAMAIGGLHLAGPFREALTRVRDDHPGSQEAEAAAALLSNLERNEKGDPPPPAKGEADGPPQYQHEKGEHFVILIVPNRAGPIANTTAAISNFNERFFRNKGIKVKASIWNQDSQVLLIRPFDSKGAAMTYYELFKQNKNELKGINDQDYPLFVIGSGNYARFYVTKDQAGYAEFFSRNYLDGK